MATTKELWDAGAPQAPAGFAAWGSQVSDGLGLREVVVYTEGGVFEKANYPWARLFRVMVQAGGGAGGGATATGAGERSAGGGGQGGWYAESLLLPSALGASEPVTVGDGGTGAAGTTGGTGGSSSFGTHVAADGGAGGSTQAANTNEFITHVGGDAGSATGDLVIPPGAGGPASLFSVAARGGFGGHSRLSGSRRPSNGNNQNGVSGRNHGGGGTGGHNVANQGSTRTGGNGAPGIVIVEVYG